MDNNQIKTILTDYLEQQEEIVFAYLYGSFVNKEQFRDIDIGIYSRSPKLITRGRMHTDLVKKTKKQVDLIYLNDLPEKHPAFAYQIVCKGELLFGKNHELQTDYKRRAFLRYFDTAPLRKQMQQAFNKRLKDNKFGMRNYA